MVNEIEISIPRKLKNPARLPSNIPIPNGRNDTTPKIIEPVYIGITDNNSIEFIPNDKSNKCIATHSTSQKSVLSIVL